MSFVACIVIENVPENIYNAPRWLFAFTPALNCVSVKGAIIT